MSIPEIIWFQNPHEHRNHLLLFGFMKLHKSGKIRFIYKPYEELERYIDAPKIKDHIHRHTSFFLFKEQGQELRVLVDSEDSFAQLCPLIEEVDVYFAAAYNTRFYKDHNFIDPYHWQTTEDVAVYKRRAEELIKRYGQHFRKARKFVPIGPNSAYPVKKSYLAQKFQNAQDKYYRLLRNQINWEPQYAIFEARYQYLKQLRQASPQYDVVLHDTLWGWPVHRYKLHQELKRLSNQYRIHSVLKWHDSNEANPLDAGEFPIISHPIEGNYEEMLASSRLAVFATGYHWGWRNIMTLAFYWGLPVLMDEPMFESYFDIKEFRYFSHHSGEWNEIESLLKQAEGINRDETKAHNQATYDKYMLPEKVAEYALGKIIEETLE